LRRDETKPKIRSCNGSHVTADQGETVLHRPSEHTPRGHLVEHGFFVRELDFARCCSI